MRKGNNPLCPENKLRCSDAVIILNSGYPPNHLDHVHVLCMSDYPCECKVKA